MNTIDKSCMFFSASSIRDAEALLNAGINDILVSYFYLSKRASYYENEIIPRILANKGIFMTDSGGFSFITGNIKPEYYTEEFWLPYLNRYVQWLTDNHKNIYVAANLDLDRFLGREKIVEWNEKYFKPLEKYMQVVYVAHRDWDNVYSDYHGLKRLKEYCSMYAYVGVNKNYADNYERVAAIAQTTKTRVHGFAWTSIPRLLSKPMFSVDSTSWLSGVRYGSSYVYDGANFKVYDASDKNIRKWRKLKIKEEKIDYNKLLAEDSDAVNSFNLVAWKGARDKYVKVANTKLWNKPVLSYAKNIR